MSEDEKNGIKLPGVEISYPNTKIGVFSVLIICVTVVLILLIVFVWATPKNMREVTNFAETVQQTELSRYRYTADGKSEKLTERTQIQFMTPSTESWNYHKAKYGYKKMTDIEIKDFDKRFNWEKNVDMSKIERFAQEIKKRGISTGYRYYNYHGEGSTQEDEGLWWVITIDTDKTLNDFVTFYLEFWSSPKGLYIEELKTTADIKPNK